MTKDEINALELGEPQRDKWEHISGYEVIGSWGATRAKIVAAAFQPGKWRFTTLGYAEWPGSRPFNSAHDALEGLKDWLLARIGYSRTSENKGLLRGKACR